MADRTSARLFGKFFTMLSKNLTEENKNFAKELFEDAKEYDFSWSQMDADEALIKLELAKMGIDDNYPEDGEQVIYND